MKIVYSPHALKRLKQRKILVVEVLKTLKNPDNEFDSARNRKIVNKRFSRRTLEIVYVIENKTLIIITLYYL
jgi:hypothetical protein